MKKSLFLIFSFILLFFSGCTQSLSYQSSKHLSEFDNICFAYFSESCKISYICGKREKNYQIDGKNNKLINFGILQVDFFGSFQLESITAKLFVNNKMYELKLIYNPIDFSFVQDFKLIVKSTDKLFVKIIVKTKNNEFILENKLNRTNENWIVNNADALKIATNCLQDELNNNFVVNGKLQAEVFVQIITCKDTNKYFWLVCFVNQKKQKLQIIIDPITANFLVDEN